MKGVLVDTSAWVDHCRRRNDVLVDLLELDQVMLHPLIVGEIACGTPPNRVHTLADLNGLQQAQRASIREVMDFVEREHLFGLGRGFVDLLLLASTLMKPAACISAMVCSGTFESASASPQRARRAGTIARDRA